VAIAVQDRVFIGGEYRDSIYSDRREGAFLVAVNCIEPGGTCFCSSMGTGPGADAGFDLVLTEIEGEGVHQFLIRAGSARGADVLGALPVQAAPDDTVATAAGLIADAATRMGRTLDTADIKDLLQRNPRHPRWDEVAARCLACANCTMVCPTCFCATVEDGGDLSGTEAWRVRRWDSCFTQEFSYIHGGSLRVSGSARYRQWMTHKLASWFDQFGTSGCVGCGRCITWCPVGIDITEEVEAIRETEEEAYVRARPTP
jgi:ferredoxin